jgi:uncharacterized protein
MQVYNSMIGDDGWCTNYDKSTRTCNIYQGNLPTHNSESIFSSTNIWLYDILTDASRFAIVDRPFFCRVEPKVFEEFFGVARSRFDREACRFAPTWLIHLQVGQGSDLFVYLLSCCLQCLCG